tara:strand:- start:1 stop:105 length:105 start_codon:yes stop_codon:yes gene_type:complete
MIDTSWSSIRLALVLVMGVVWIYLINHPPRDDDK